jgi:hypothetical protein
MRFLITATDISGRIILRRETTAAALKKAAELAEDGVVKLRLPRRTDVNIRRRRSTSFQRMARAEREVRLWVEHIFRGLNGAVPAIFGLAWLRLQVRRVP